MESMAHQERAEMAVQTERVVSMEHRALQEKMEIFGAKGSNGTSGSSGVCGSSGTSGVGYSFEQIDSRSKTLLDFTKSQILFLNLNNNTTLNFAGFPVGIFYLIVKQGIGNYSVTFPYVLKQAKGFEYVPSIFPNAVDVLQFMCDGTSFYVIDCKKEY